MVASCASGPPGDGTPRALMSMRSRIAHRRALPFRAVNNPGSPAHDPGLQRHHLLPRQLLSSKCFGRMFDAIGLARIGFDDFRRNGVLLPAAEKTALRLALPLHRGPHRSYNEMAGERVGQIDREWRRNCRNCPDQAGVDALMRLALLQAALRRRLLEAGRLRLQLNRFDPIGAGKDFAELDAMADALWGATGPMVSAAPNSPR